ncbi:NDR1/HIN1-like protein 6 [Lactuca sativa]|uniref:NDR1/HIN1-like protein 6 n=1 Tax=Lactuca sativa TaxID=4236 RepID=UPI000CBE6924|nr:NDR1/HIN1-like protein 6 [Lactuca sativa]
MGVVSEGKGYSGFVRCMCWCCCLLLLVIIISGGFAYYIYSAEDPKPPVYDIQSFTVNTLDLEDDSTLKTEFVVIFKIENPNEKIGFVYGKKNNISLLFDDEIISCGQLPAYKQGPANTTVLEVTLAGTSPDESSTYQDIVQNGKEKGVGMEFVVKMSVPMKFYVGNVGDVARKEVIASISCGLVMKNLVSGKTATILEKECEELVKF